MTEPEDGIRLDEMAVPAGHINSYYAATAANLRDWPPIDAPRQCEVCVIGGGLAGLATALRLAESGVDVVVLESRRLAWAASGRNGGFVSPGFAESIFNIEKKLGLAHSRELYQASVEGVTAIREIIRASGRHEIIGGQGWLKMIRHARVYELERHGQRMARDYGAPVNFIDRRGLEEFVASNAYHAGLLDMTPFHIQPLEFADLLSDLIHGAGGKLFENSRVRRVSRSGTAWRVRVNAINVEARHVVLATSAYGGPSRRVNGAVLPVATYIIAAASRQGKLDEAIRFSGCIGDTRRASDYYRLVGTGEERQLLWGGRITTRRSVPANIAAGLLNDIRAIYPQLDDLQVRFSWSGLMGYAVHRMPIIRRLDDGLWAATAFGGHGLNTAMMAGQLVAEAITDRSDRIRLFDPFRAIWAGGPVGRASAQIEYWRLKLLDIVSERRART